MIEVKDLTKSFGERTAVDHVSFVVNKGEILGFLGPNGAGKTTTMRILTGFLPATSGTAKVAGFDVFNDSLEVRKRIGYLPENPPLYLDMTVAAYLDFVARIKNVPAEKRRGSVDRHRLTVGTDLQSDVDALTSIDRNRKTLRGAGIKAVSLRRNLILPDLYIGELIGALRVSLRSDLSLGLLIDHRDSSARDNRTGAIAHITENRRGLELCID